MDTVFFIISSTIFLLILIGFVINLLFVNRSRVLKHKAQVIELQGKFEREILRAQVEVVEQTLEEVSRELHDDIGQMLTYQVLHIYHLQTLSKPDLDNALIDLGDSIKNTLQSIRLISKALNGKNILSSGLLNSIFQLSDRTIKQGLGVELNLPSVSPFSEKSTELFVYRILQELCSNTLKHAAATKITITIETKHNEAYIHYFDDGSGLPFEIVDSKYETMGLRNISNRVNLLYGTIEFIGNNENGFYIRLKIPIT